MSHPANPMYGDVCLEHEGPPTEHSPSASAASLPTSPHVRDGVAMESPLAFVIHAPSPRREHAFAHPLTQEVAYGSQLVHRHVRVETAVSGALGRAAVQLNERAAVLAHHWEAAGEPLAAEHCHRRAALWALRTDFAAAGRHRERLRALARCLPESPDQAELGATACSQLLFPVSRMGGPEGEATAVVEEGKDLGRRDPRCSSAVRRPVQPRSLLQLLPRCAPRSRPHGDSPSARNGPRPQLHLYEVRLAQRGGASGASLEKGPA